MLDKLAPQLRAQVRPHLPGEAGARGAHERAPALRGAALRASMGEVATVVEAVFEGALRGGGGVDEAVGKAWVESLVGDAGEAVVGVTGESGVAVGESSAAGGGVAHRGRLLKLDLGATADGVFNGLLGLLAEAVVPQAVTGRSQGSE